MDYPDLSDIFGQYFNNKVYNKDSKVKTEAPSEKDKLTKLNFPNDRRGYYVPSDFPADLTKEQLQELKKEYTRLRDIAHKRIGRLEEKHILFPEDLDRLKSMIPKISEMENPSEEIQFALSNVSRLLNKEPSTIPKAKEYARARIKQMDNLIANIEPYIKSENVRQKIMDYRINKNFSGLYVMYRAIWAFIDYTKNVMQNNYFYWTEDEQKKFWKNKEIINKLMSFDLSGAYDIYKKEIQDNHEEEGDFEEWENFTL